MCRMTGIVSIRGAYGNYKSEYVVEGDLLTYEASRVLCKAEYVPKKGMCAVGGWYMPSKANMCHTGRVCAIESDLFTVEDECV